MQTEPSGQRKISSLVQTPGSNVSSPGSPEPDTRFFGCFLLLVTRFFFNQQTRILFEKPRIAVHSNTSNSDNTEVEVWHVQRPN